MEEFKVELRNKIVCAIQHISDDSVDRVIHELTEVIGIVEMDDMELLKEDDLKTVLKPIEIRKLLKSLDTKSMLCSFFLSIMLLPACIFIFVELGYLAIFRFKPRHQRG